ncbi:MAG: carboxypeptidase regulatory-like domain-containing protein, partial [Nitrososphaerota archaeon]|nr:carboxypeptidase regulatory-like domain-containing protein [Nitrososphaerota archaeon]
YAGERFTVCADGYEANLPSVCVPVALDAYRNATAVIKLIQPGVLRGTVVDAATGSPVSSWSANVYSLNATGYASYVTSIGNSTSSLYYGVPQLGEYRLDVFSYVGSDELWGQVTVNASASQVYQLGDISLYMGAGDLFTGKAGNTLSVIPGESAPGGTLFLRATYNYTGSFALGNVSVLLPAPAGTTAVAGGFLLDGKPVNASLSSSGYYSVPLGNISSGASGEVRYELQIGGGYNGSSLALLALVNYTVGGKAYEEALATAVETVEQVTLSAPLSLSTLNTTVSGQAPPGSALDLYSNDTLLGTAYVPAGGYWGLNVTLPSAGNQTTYQLHAVALTASGVHVYSPSVSVAYDNTEPQIVKICMEQTDGRLMCWDPQDGVPHFPYVFVPGMPMTFTLTFSQPSLVDDVSVSVPGVGTVNATLDQDGLYRATMVPYAFGDVYVNYNVLRIPKGNGVTLPFPTVAQILSGLPPGLIDHANYTVLANTTTSFDLLINVPSNMSYVFGGTSLEVSATFTPNELYTLTAGDIRNLTETGYPVYNITSSTRVTSNGTSYYSSFFVPYSALPPAIVKELDQPMSTCSNCPTVGGEGVSIGQKAVEGVAPKLLEDGQPLGRAIPFAGAFFSAWGWFDDHQWVELQDAKLQQLTSCASSAPGAFASQSQSFINEANKYSATVSGLGHVAEGNDVAGGVLSFVPLAGSEAGMVSGGLSIAYSVGESHLSAQISAAISNCEKDLHSAPPGSDTANVNPIEDPSGVVYAGLLTNPVANATVTVFQFNSTEGQWVPWGASGYGQLNPQQTDPEGRYAWFVPAGRYMVVVQAPGFSTARSIVVYVPPPATGVDINLLPLSSPEVSGVSAFSNSTGSYIELSFDQLMKASLLNGSTITVSAPGGQSVSGRVVPVAPQTAPNGDSLTSEVVFIPSAPLTAGTNYTVTVSTTVSNYANMTMSSPYTASVSLAVRIYSLSTSALDLGVGEPVNATAVTNDPLAKYVQFTWISPAGALVSSTTAALLSSGSSASITPNSNGTWVVDASFTDGTNVIKTISRTFYVVEPAPLSGVFSTATTNSSGSASVDDALINGVSVTVTGLAPGIGLSVNSFDYQTVPPGTPSLAGTATYFDLEVSGASTGNAIVCFSGAAVTSSYLLYYYSSSTGQWLL